MHAPRQNLRRAFTLIEILIVVAIIVVLVAILVPVLGRAKETARKAAALSQLQSLSTGLAQYFTDFNMYPPSSNLLGPTYASIPPYRGDIMLAQGLLGFLPGYNDVTKTGDGAGTFIGGPPPVPTSDPSDMGFRINRNAAAMGGKIYGPYASTDEKTFRANPYAAPNTDDKYFIDPWGNEIIYYRSTRSFPGTTPLAAPGQDLPGPVTRIFRDVPFPNEPFFFDLDDCRACKSTGYASTPDKEIFLSPLATPPGITQNYIFKLLGASQNTDVANVKGASSFLLISAGPDQLYFTLDDIVVTK